MKILRTTLYKIKMTKKCKLAMFYRNVVVIKRIFPNIVNELKSDNNNRISYASGITD